MSIRRSEKNPIIVPGDVTPSREDFEVLCAFNAGVTLSDDEVILLLRVAERPVQDDEGVYKVAIHDPSTDVTGIVALDRADDRNDFSDPRVITTPAGAYLTTISHLRIARSRDGLTFSIDESPSLYPATEYETFGIEDPRITRLGSDYWINNTAVSERGVTTALARTLDFTSYEREGVIFCPDNKDVCIFPERIDGRYYALHRPSSGFGRNEIWIASSLDLIRWGEHRHLMGVRSGYWDSGRVGGSLVPFETDDGWIEIYHGATPDHRYALGAVLLDRAEPWRVLARSKRPIMEPEADYELNGFLGNVIFSCGGFVRDETVHLYYGASDTTTCYAEVPLEHIYDSLEPTE